MSPTSPRRPHWLPLTDRASLLAALAAHLQSLPDLHPDRFTLTEVVSEVGVAAARAQLDRVPSGGLRVAAGIAVDSCQIRLSASELQALRSVPGLPSSVARALGHYATAGAPAAGAAADDRPREWST